jgi:hypothetical protein
MLYKWNLIGVGHFLPAPEGATSLCLCPRFAPVLGANLGAEAAKILAIYFGHPESLMKVHQHRIKRRILC